MTISNNLSYLQKTDYVGRNNQKQDENNKTYAQMIDDANFDGSVLLDITASELAAAWQEVMRIQGVSDPSKVDGALLGKIKDERAFETDPVKIRQNIQDQIAILQDGKTMTLRYHRDENGQMKQLSAYAYEQMKDRVSDVLGEILQDIKV
ncbi:hypothetical protein RCM89_17810 [Escherichia marmotae]|nr:hypothetical protein [Escherichia marmotae]